MEQEPNNQQQQPTAEPSTQAQPQAPQQPAQQPPETPPGQEQGGDARVLKLTQDELNRIVTDRLERKERQHQEQIQDYERRLREAGTRPAQQERTPEPPKAEPPKGGESVPQEVTEKLSSFEQRLDASESARRFSEGLLDTDLKLSSDQREVMRTLFDAQKPEDTVKWLKETATKLGISVAQSAQTEQPAAQQPNGQQPQQAPQHPPQPPSISAPSTMDELERGDVHPNRLTSDQIARMGPQKVYEYAKEYFRKQSSGGY